MTKAELLRELAHVALMGNTEEARYNAASLIVTYLNDPEITTAYVNAAKWYA